MGHFLPFYPPPTLTPWQSKFWKNEKSIWRCITLHVYTLPKITIICMLPEICSAKDIIFCQFGPFFALLPCYWSRKLKFEKNVKNPRVIILLHMCTINEDHMIYNSWDIKAVEFFVIWGHFLPSDPPNNPKNQNFEKHTWRYHHFTHVYHK